MQYSPVLHVVIRMPSSDHVHSDHEQQLAKIMAEVGSTIDSIYLRKVYTICGSSTSSPGMSLQEWLDEDSKESLNDEEQINRTKTW